MSTEDTKVVVNLQNTDSLDDIEKTTSNLKFAIVDKLTDGGTVIPSDKEGVEVLLKVVSSIDSQTNNRRKNSIEERQVDAAAQTAANVASIIKTFGGNPFSGKTGITIEHNLDLPEPKIVPNIDYRGTEKLEYEEFVMESKD